MGKLVCACALLATATLAAPAFAAAPGTVVKLPLPKDNQGAIYELTASAKIPAGVTFSSTGSPWILNVTNQPDLPSYIRAAAVVVPAGTGVWHIFVAINAPKAALKGRRLARVAVPVTVAANIQATPPLNTWSPSVTQTSHSDACLALGVLAGLKGGLSEAAYVIMIGASPGEASTIVGFTEKADPHCKK